MSEIKKCNDTFCKKYVDDAKDIMETIINRMIKKHNINKLEKKEKEEAINKIRKSIEKVMNYDNLKESCKTAFCNPGCKGTIFQNQNNKLTKELEKKYKNNKELLVLLKKMRDNLFQNKKTVLKNNFYIKIKNPKKLKKDGEISGCTFRTY
jgi:ribosomal protein L16 Arg81 hydroxylase